MPSILIVPDTESGSAKERFKPRERVERQGPPR